MQIYKLTDEKGETFGNTQWGENVTHAATEAGNAPCANQVIHSYLSPEVAAFCNPIHSNFVRPQCWLAEGEITGCDGLKLWGKSVTTLRRVSLPEITTEQRVEIAIRISLLRYREKSYVAWAEKWLSGKDRSYRTAAAGSAAQSAARAAMTAAWAAAAAAATVYPATWALDKKSFNIGLHMLICSVIYK